MNGLNLAENLVRLRRERKITQEELADFIGVTKASVSKWENEQSTPDILLLPQLAAFFSVTVDELMGYEAQLSQEQILRCYGDLTKDFAALPFEEALEKVHSLVHRYYSCYPFLLQVCVLYVNHFMLAETEDGKKAVLREADELCDRIIQYCSDVGICGDATALKAMISLQLGNPLEVIETLKSVADPSRLSEQNSMLLIQAYQMAGDMEKARSYTQIRLYLQLLELIGTSMQHLSLYIEEPERCEETIQRVKGVMELYQAEELHPNLAAQFHYQAAVVYSVNGKEEQVLTELEGFEKCISRLMESQCIVLHGDNYFDELDQWISRLPLGEQAPRDKRFAKKSALEALEHPAFSMLKETAEFKRIYSCIQEGGK